MMGNHMRLLSQPDTDCIFESGTGETFIYKAAAMQGWRKYQEDRFICIPHFFEDCSYFAVFDGHGGSEIAEFLRRRLHFEILATLKREGDIELALYSGFLSCDVSLTEPEIIAELNDMIKEENRGALQIMRRAEVLDEEMPGADEVQPNIAGPSNERPIADDFIEEDLATEVHEPKSQYPLEHYGRDYPCFPSRSQGNQRSQQVSEERMQVERPLHYMLADDIDALSDPGDEDFNINEEEESSTTESEEGDVGFEIAAEEFFNQEPGFLSGSTATVAIILPNRIYIANVGDSRCVLSRSGVAIDLSVDHKPEDPEERARIIGAGGSVSDDGRVNNCLNLSRAFGDFKFKARSFEPSQQCISVEPFINSVDIDEEDDFVIIASDGIWNSMSSQEVVDYIHLRLRNGDSDLQIICEDMFRLILASDTDNDGIGCDNMCCVIIKFNKKGGSSNIYQAGASGKVMSAGDSLKQDRKNADASTSGSTEQITEDIAEKR